MLEDQSNENETINVPEGDKQHDPQSEPKIEQKDLKTSENTQKNQPPSNQLSLDLSNLLGKNVANGYC